MSEITDRAAEVNRHAWDSLRRQRDEEALIHPDAVPTMLAQAPDNIIVDDLTPEMIRKEFYIHLLAYNLIRQLQFEAGFESEALPITLSFKATVQHFSNFVVLLAHSIAQRRIHFYHQLIMLISKEILDVRSNRVEPRVVKRRPKSYRRMTVPRKQLKRKCKNRKINPQTAQMTPSY